MDKIYRAVVAIERFWISRWPLKRGRYLFARFHSLLYRLHILMPRWVATDTGLTILVDSRDFIGQSIYLERSFEPTVIQSLVRLLPKNGVFLDVGANIGLMTVSIAKSAANPRRVIAIEPSPKHCEILKRNIEVNNATSAMAINCALGDENSILPLYLGANQNQGRNSFSKENAQGEGECHHVQVLVGDLLLSDLQVDCIDLVKVDVEGAEFKVLKGLERVLRKSYPPIVIEFIEEQLKAFGTSVAEVKGWLISIGYTDIEPLDSVNSLVVRKKL